MKPNSMENLKLEKLQTYVKSLVKTEASALSQMLSIQVQCSLEDIFTVEFYNLENKLSISARKTYCAVYVRGDGDLKIEFLYFLDMESAKKISQMLCGKIQVESYELAMSSISEMGNMLAGSFLNELSNIGILVRQSIPGLAIGTFEPILETPLSDIVKSSSDVVVIETEFHSINNDVSVSGIILLQPTDVEKMLRGIELRQ